MKYETPKQEKSPTTKIGGGAGAITTAALHMTSLLRHKEKQSTRRFLYSIVGFISYPIAGYIVGEKIESTINNNNNVLPIVEIANEKPVFVKNSSLKDRKPRGHIESVKRFKDEINYPEIGVRVGFKTVVYSPDDEIYIEGFLIKDTNREIYDATIAGLFYEQLDDDCLTAVEILFRLGFATNIIQDQHGKLGLIINPSHYPGFSGDELFRGSSEKFKSLQNDVANLRILFNKICQEHSINFDITDFDNAAELLLQIYSEEYHVDSEWNFDGKDFDEDKLNKLAAKKSMTKDFLDGSNRYQSPIDLSDIGGYTANILKLLDFLTDHCGFKLQVSKDGDLVLIKV